MIFVQPVVHVPIADAGLLHNVKLAIFGKPLLVYMYCRGVLDNKGDPSEAGDFQASGSKTQPCDTTAPQESAALAGSKIPVAV